jgi:HAD superfamily hydrolase (TIGR01549 family)
VSEGNGGASDRPAAILDIDGTLVDTNYHHAIAWYRAFRDRGFTLPLWQLHRHIGMGGDQFVEAMIGEEADREHGDAIRDAHDEGYMEIIGEVAPLEGARELIEDLAGRGHAVILASSANPDEVEHYLDLLGARELVKAWTTAEDVEETKPEPDLVKSALEKAGGGPAVMVGDTVWDCEAAGQVDVPVIAVLTGGFSREELDAAGAAVVFDSIEELRGRLADTPLG